ncbi:MAG: MBL fold metallo-hydrolase [Bacteroidetes bacterium]|nr:MBL fold metallo-hydrolase [Bacteroidota bacterium]
MKIIPLSEGWFTVDKTKQFVPFHSTQDQVQSIPSDSLLVEIQPFVVCTTKDIILLDTGLGYRVGGTLQLHANLYKAGIEPLSVTKVILSHLHKDHCGGMIEVEGDLIKPAFPNATYYVQEAELQHAAAHIGSSYPATPVEWISSYSKVVRLQGNQQIDDLITCTLSGGHARFHQSILISENNNIVFYGGDEAPQLQQMRHRFVAKYDFDGRRAMELRQQWWKQGQQEGWTFLFYHDVKNPTFSFQLS